MARLENQHVRRHEGAELTVWHGFQLEMLGEFVDHLFWLIQD
jgi:hypothetical protein